MKPGRLCTEKSCLVLTSANSVSDRRALTLMRSNGVACGWCLSEAESGGGGGKRVPDWDRGDSAFDVDVRWVRPLMDGSQRLG